MSHTTTTHPTLRHRWGLPRFGYYSNTAVLALATRMLPLAYALAYVVALYFFLFAPKARRASMKYLDLLHAPRQRPPLTRLWHTYRHLTHFGFLLLDRGVMLAHPQHGFRIECQGLTHLAQTLTPPRDSSAHRSPPSATARAEQAPLPKQSPTPQGVILLSAHFGNAEIGVPYIPLMGFTRPTHIVMYQDLSDGTERFHARYRKLLAGLHIISTTNPLTAGLHIMAALKKGDTVAMRADRTLHGKGLPVTFLGQRVQLPAGPFMAAVLSGAPVLYIYTCRLSYRRYTCRFSPIHRYVETPETPREALLTRAAQDYATHLESLLKEFPFQWSNFYDYWTEQRPAEPLQ